jgi:hypothetical protein
MVLVVLRLPQARPSRLPARVHQETVNTVSCVTPGAGVMLHHAPPNA